MMVSSVMLEYETKFNLKKKKTTLEESTVPVNCLPTSNF